MGVGAGGGVMWCGVVGPQGGGWGSGLGVGQLVAAVGGRCRVWAWAPCACVGACVVAVGFGVPCGESGVYGTVALQG